MTNLKSPTESESTNKHPSFFELDSLVVGAPTDRAVQLHLAHCELCAAYVAARRRRANDELPRWLSGIRSKFPSDVAPAEPPESFVVPAPLLAAKSDLTSQQRRQVVWHFEMLDEWNYYEVLGAGVSDDQRTIQRRYRERALQWHPDRWRKDLGPFAPMIQTIFNRVRSAYSALTDPTKRDQYNETLGPIVDESAIEQMHIAEVQRERNTRRDDHRRERQANLRRRRNPFIARRKRARQFAEEARAREVEGDLFEALKLAQLACAYDPRNTSIEAQRARLEQEVAPLRAEAPMRRGRAAESYAKWEEAIDWYERALETSQDLPEPRKRLAYCMVMARYDGQASLSHAMAAVKALPLDPEAHFILGLAYERVESFSAAQRALQRAIELKPNYAEVRKTLRRLKWGF